MPVRERFSLWMFAPLFVSLADGLERTIDCHREQRLLDARAAGP